MRFFMKALLYYTLAGSAVAAEFIVPDSSAGEPKVIGAAPAEPSAWPATFIFRTKAGRGCTATAIGGQVILTAAHCVTNGEGGTVQVGGKKVAVVCDQHPLYATKDTSMDFALCLAAQNLTGFAYENVGTSVAFPKKGETVKLLGFGCTKEGGFDKAFGVLYLGDGKVFRRPPGADNFTVTKGLAAVCFGDSGGAAYFYINDSGRFVVAVNSKGDISEYSFLASTFTTGFVDWALEWTEKNNSAICGINTGAKGCRPL